jgi:coenzyme F420-reducing hydrogenase beta subunit
MLNECEPNKNYVAFAAFSNDPDIRSGCSSGGIAYEILKLQLSQNSKICGVVYNIDAHRAEHTIGSNESECIPMKGSKYIQSFTEQAFSKLFDGNNYIVFGTPCQIASIHNAAKLRKIRDRFILIDFFCHGVPSYLLWKQYLKHMKAFESKAIYFRNKKYGWHSFTLKIDYENYDLHSDMNRDKDLFYLFFLGNYCLNEACYKCKRQINCHIESPVLK